LIISHEHKFIFFKTRKTASTSVDMALSRHCGDGDVISYLNREDEALKEMLGLRRAQNFHVPARYWTLADATKFVFKGRRPRYTEHMSASSLKQRLDREAWRSYFKFCVERNPFDKAVSLYYWRTRDQAVKPTLEEFLHSVEETSLSNVGIYAANGCLQVDYIVRYEQLEVGLKSVAETLGLNGLDLPQAKSGIRKEKAHYRDLMSEESRVIVERVCSKEIELLEYEF
jgi:hypothetical protein